MTPQRTVCEQHEEIRRDLRQIKKWLMVLTIVVGISGGVSERGEWKKIIGAVVDVFSHSGATIARGEQK